MRTRTCGQQRRSYSNGSQSKARLAHLLLASHLLSDSTREIRLIFYFLYLVFFGGEGTCDKFRPTQRCPRVRRMRTETCGQQRCSHSNGSQDKGILGHLLLDSNLLTYYLRVTFYFLYVIFGNACDKFRPMRTRIKWNALNELELGGISIKRLANCRISRN